MKIELKKKKPTAPGFYLFKKPGHYLPQIADVRLTHGELEIVYSGGCYPLSRCDKNVLWSEKIDIV